MAPAFAGATVGKPAPRAFEIPSIFFYVFFAFLAAAMCTQINVRLGITPNTSVIGVIAAIGIGRSFLPLFRDVERQNFLQTAMSAGGFAAANIALVSVSLLYLLDLRPLIPALFVGVTVGMAADLYLAYRLFDTEAFPASGPWPDGVATGQVILTGDAGGEKARHLLQGVLAGGAGGLLSLPMAGVGIAFIGNPISLGALGVGLLLRGFGDAWFQGSYFPHGFMIGAGLVQVAQTVRLVLRRVALPKTLSLGARVGPHELNENHLTEIALHLVAFLAGASVLYVVSGPVSLSYGKLVLWLGFAAGAAFVHTLIVGYCAMLTGWFPSFAVAIALILVAVLLRFPIPLLALLAGYILSTGPLFADLGYDLKTGWMVRGRGADSAAERTGRFQQFLLQEIGGFTGIVFVILFFETYFRLGLIPPMSKALSATVSISLSGAHVHKMTIAALAGALLQIAGGPSRAVGVLFATGLLLVNPVYGVGLLVAVLFRVTAGGRFMEIRAPGLIAGDGLASFARALWLVFS